MDEPNDKPPPKQGKKYHQHELFPGDADLEPYKLIEDFENLLRHYKKYKQVRLPGVEVVIEQRRPRRAKRPQGLPSRGADAPRPASPPRTPERLLCYALPRREREAILGCLAEDFHANVLQYGEAKARRIYFVDVVRSAGPSLLHKLHRLVTLPGLVKLMEWIGRMSG